MNDNECSDYYLAWHILKRPKLFYEAETLRDVLALIQGAAIARYPWHGNGFLGDFWEFLRDRLNAPHCAAYSTLLKRFPNKPYREGCDAILNLLEEWNAAKNGPATH